MRRISHQVTRGKRRPIRAPAARPSWPDGLGQADATLVEAVAGLRALGSLRPTLAMVLGSGFQQALTGMDVEGQAAYERLPGFAPVGVSGHTGEALVGRLGGTPLLMLSGRAHYYEGHSMAAITFAVRALAAYGITDLLLTNAAGAINRRFQPGDFMVMKDHINLMGANPLRGPAETDLPRFVDMSDAYDRGLQRLLLEAGNRCRLKLRSGVYLAVCGPSYETPAEIRAFARMGADAVGMSTVPEVLVARQCGIKVAGLSCITNLAAGRAKHPLSHAEVLETAEQVESLAGGILKGFAALYAHRV